MAKRPVECGHPEIPHHAFGLCRRCYEIQFKRLGPLPRSRPYRPQLNRVTTYDKWLDYKALGYSQEYAAKSLGIRIDSLKRAIIRQRHRVAATLN